MNGLNDKIDNYLKKKRCNTTIYTIVCVLIAIPIFSVFFLPNMGATSQTTGTVTRLIGFPTDEGHNLYLLVRLKNGHNVRSFISNSSFYKKDRQVKLEKQEPLFFGKPVYRFRGYVEKKENI
ncbi:MAG: hypothetical protein ACKE9I_04015 [Methylophagaceae bacterium]